MKSGVGDLHPGLTGAAELVVTEQNTALHMGSGRMPVLATPAMIALIEAAAQNAVDRLLPQGYQTVGTYLDVRHDGATPVGMRVIATAELIAIDGRTLSFKFVVIDDKEKVGEGMHQRTMSSIASFNRLLQQKMKRQE